MMNPYLLLTLSFLLSLSRLDAASWYLRTNQAGNWNTLSEWWSSPTGTGGTHPTSISSADTFYSNGWSVRTPVTSNPETFAGKLVLDGGSVVLKSLSSTVTATIPNLTSIGGASRSISTGSNGNLIVNINNMTVGENESTTFSTGGTTRGITASIGTLSGGGNLSLEGGGTMSLGITSAPKFYGTIKITGSTKVSFQNSIATKGAMVIEAGTQITLNQNLTVTGLLIGCTTDGAAQQLGGTKYASNQTYSFATLQAAFPAIFVAGTGNITVTQPNLVADAAVVVDYVGSGQLSANVETGFGNISRDANAVRLGLWRIGTIPKWGDATETLDGLDVAVAKSINGGSQPLFIQYIDTAAHNPSFMDALYTVNGTKGPGSGATPGTNLVYLAKRYKAAPFNLTTQHWEVGNEPDIAVNYRVTSAGEYVAFYQNCHNELVAAGIRSNIKLCGPVVAWEYGFDGSFGYADQILDTFLASCNTPLNGYNQVDVVTRHVYPSIYTWETDPDTANTAYNLLNAPTEQVTFIPQRHGRWPGRGEGGILSEMRRLGYPASTMTGITEFNVSGTYKHTITQGLWFLIYDHFSLYNSRHELGNGFIMGKVTDGFSYYKSDGTPSFGYWATYVHGRLTGDEVLAQSSSDPHLLMTATKDASYVYVQVLNRNDVSMGATVALSNAPVTGTPTRYEFSATATPSVGTSTTLGTNFSYTFPAMTATIFRYNRSDAPPPQPPSAPPTPIILDTDFSSAPSGILTYHTLFQPIVANGDLQLTKAVANSAGTAIFNGQPLTASKTRVQVRFGFLVPQSAANLADGFVFGAYSSNPGAVGGIWDADGYYGQNNRFWGVKVDNAPKEFAVLPGGNYLTSTCTGWAKQSIAAFAAKEMFVVIDYDSGNVRARLYEGTSDTGILVADISNRVGNPVSLPAGTVFGFAGACSHSAQNVFIHGLRITADSGATDSPPVITSSATASATVGSPFSYQITATNSPSSFGASPLPAGVSINSSTGLISGTPTTAGTTNVVVSATNAAGTGTMTLALTINPSGGGTNTAFVTSVTSFGTLVNNYTGWRGMQIDVGAAPITVKELGRWVVSGNTGTHTIKVTTTTGSTVATVAVNTLGAPAGAFKFATLATPVTLSANTSYYVVSQETNGGDQHYNDTGTALATTGVAAVRRGVFSPDGITWTIHSSFNAYGPVSFKY